MCELDRTDHILTTVTQEGIDAITDLGYAPSHLLIWVPTATLN